MPALRFRLLLRNLLYLRNFESIIRRLAGDGHEVLITSSPNDRKVPAELRVLANRLKAEYPTVSFGTTAERTGFWQPLAVWLRTTRNALRFRRPEYASAPALADRAINRQSFLGPVTRRLVGLAPFRNRRINDAANWLLKVCDRAMPPDRAIVQELRGTRPDCLLVSPMVDLLSDQVDWIDAARAARVPSCLLVASWDNLTNKGLILTPPDRVVVWNAFQKDEAVRMHGIAPDTVVVTGAQLYDEWFARRPRRDYASFCEGFGFDPARPTLLYCGSSRFISGDEGAFVERWIAAVRSAEDPELAGANLLIRPHPMHQAPYERLDYGPADRIAVHPKKGGMPVHDDAKADYFDALYHARAVVGINTSALIEAAILGRRSFTVEEPAFSDTQEGTLHFRYLVDGGPLVKAPDLSTHLGHLAAELAAEDRREATLAGFVTDFLRPRGLDQPATQVLSEAILAMPSVAPRPRITAATWPVTLLLAPIAALAYAVARRPRWTVVLQKLLRRGIFMLAQRRNQDGTDLIAVPQSVDYAGEPIEMLATSPEAAATRTRSAAREPWTVAWAERAIVAGDVVYDIGAHTGLASLLIGAIHQEAVRVLAFEPSFATYAALCRNVLHNALSGSVTPLPTLIHGSVGTIPLKYRSIDSGIGRHAIGTVSLGVRARVKETRPVFEQPMPSVTLDALVRDHGLPAPTHLRLNVNGSELDVIAGARDTLASGRVASALVIIDDPARADAIGAALSRHDLARAAGFTKKLGPGEAETHLFFARDPVALATIVAADPTLATNLGS